MRTVFLPQENRLKTSATLSSGPGAPIFQPGPQTRIYRAPVRAIGVAVIGDREAWGQVIDVSPGGCLFKTDDPLEIGEEITLRVTLMSETRRAIAEVAATVRRRTGDGDRPAYGLEFRASTSEERQVLQWLYGQALR